jgi:hypothetical protein
MGSFLASPPPIPGSVGFVRFALKAWYRCTPTACRSPPWKNSFTVCSLPTYLIGSAAESCVDGGIIAAIAEVVRVINKSKINVLVTLQNKDLFVFQDFITVSFTNSPHYCYFEFSLSLIGRV